MTKLIDLAKSLISIPSTSDSLENLHKVLEIAGEPLQGFYKHEFTSNNIPSVLYSNQPELNNFKILLNAHLDVVSAKPEQFKPFEYENKLYGRGAADMKSAAAAEILTFADMAKQVNFPLGLQLVTDEEVGGFAGTKYQLEQGIRTEFVIAGDSFHTQLSHQAKGIIWLDIEATGKPAHSAHPWEGKNAILKINKFINNLKNAIPVPKQETWITTVNIAKISSTNSTYNKVPNQASVGLDIRFIPEDAETIISKIQNLLPKDLTLSIKTHEPHQYTDPENPYIQKLLSLDSNIKLVKDHGASDIRHFQTYGIPGCLIGPEGAGLHSDEEWVDLKSLDNFSAILRHLLTFS